jgi:hypothetical protein
MSGFAADRCGPTHEKTLKGRCHMYVPMNNLEEWKANVLKTLRKTIDRRSFMRRGLQALTGAAMTG